jgi:hypothetical protein
VEDKVQWRAIWSGEGASLFTSVVFVAFAALLAVAAVCLLPGLGTQEMAFPGAGRLAPAVTVMVLGFSGLLASTLLNLPDTMRRMLVMLFATALLCSGFVALVGWFAVSGASGC